MQSGSAIDAFASFHRVTSDQVDRQVTPIPSEARHTQAKQATSLSDTYEDIKEEIDRMGFATKKQGKRVRGKIAEVQVKPASRR